jgi:hypothetical protein
VFIPKGSYVSSARVKWISSDTASTTAFWTLQAEMGADAAPFITSKYNISLRPRSEQVIQWMPESWNTTEATFWSPDISYLIQKIISQPSWVNGNDLVLILNGTGLREAWSYDGDPLKGAELVITFDSICTTSDICYVNINATGVQDGSSWIGAFGSLGQALDRARLCPDIQEIWIAGGTYAPYHEVNRSSGFVIPPGVALYGGFEGTEISPTQRIYGAFPTIISGDIGVENIANDNLYHIVTVEAGAEETHIDGVTIQEGFANDAPPELQRGSGIYNYGNLTLRQVIIENCTAPSIYNSPNAVLQAGTTLEIKQ